jgi:transposase
MLMFPSGVKVFLATEPTNMRKSFTGLSLLVQDVLEQDPASGHLFVFVNKRGNKVKILYWDRNGFAQWYKQLARGLFRWPIVQHCASYPITLSDLSLLLEGIDLADHQRLATINQTTIN